jgi:hypothetical protein
MTNCQGIHAKIQRFNEGYGDLECNDYQGDFPGVVYTCSATTTLTDGAVGLKVEPQEESRRRPFQRECHAAAPDDLTFFCLDNVGANFGAFEVDSSRTFLSCENDDDEVYAYPQYNLLQGIDAESKTSANFDSFLAENSFFVEFLGEDLTTTAKGGAASAASNSYSSTCVMLVATVLLPGVLAML